jgi:hypothetical protein
MPGHAGVFDAFKMGIGMAYRCRRAKASIWPVSGIATVKN